MWCWRRLLRVPWTARRSNQSILKEINPEYSLEGLMLKLKFQYFGHLMQRANSLEKTLMLVGKDWGQEKWITEDKMVGWHHWFNGHEFEQTPGDGEGQGSLARGRKELDITDRLNIITCKIPSILQGLVQVTFSHNNSPYSPTVSTLSTSEFLFHHLHIFLFTLYKLL